MDLNVVLEREGEYPVFINMGPTAKPKVRVLDIERPLICFEILKLILKNFVQILYQTDFSFLAKRQLVGTLPNSLARLIYSR